MRKLGVVLTTLSALLMSASALASDLGVSAVGPGPGGGEVVNPPTTGGGGCFFAYHIRKIGPERVDADDVIRYKIFVKNIGNCDLRRIRVSDFLPERTKFVSATPAPTFVDDERIVWENIRLEEGERAEFEVRAKIKEHCELRHFNITNTACAFTPWIGTRICDSAVTWVDNDHDHSIPVPTPPGLQ